MLGIGWNVSGGWAGQFDFGPSVFFAFGAYVAALLANHGGVNAWIGLVAGALASALVCAILTYPITRLRGHYFAIAPARGFAQGLLTLEFPGRSKGLGFYYVALVLFALVLWGARAVERSKLGYYFRAIRDDQEGAEGIGINSRVYKVVARSIMAAIFGMGGVLYAFWALAVFPDQVL